MITKEDSSLQQVLICIQTNHVLGEETGLEFTTDEFYVKSEEEMRAAFPELPQAIENTSLIAEKCNVEFEFGKYHLPHFQLPEGYTNAEYAREGFFQLLAVSILNLIIVLIGLYYIILHCI